MPRVKNRRSIMEESRRVMSHGRSDFVARYTAALALVLRYRTDRVVAVAREYDRAMAAMPDEDLRSPEKVARYLYQIRRVLSDALRDEGCEDEDVHDLCLNGWGVDVAHKLMGG